MKPTQSLIEVDGPKNMFNTYLDTSVIHGFLPIKVVTSSTMGVVHSSLRLPPSVTLDASRDPGLTILSLMLPVFFQIFPLSVFLLDSPL